MSNCHSILMTNIHLQRRAVQQWGLQLGLTWRRSQWSWWWGRGKAGNMANLSPAAPWAWAELGNIHYLNVHLTVSILVYLFGFPKIEGAWWEFQWYFKEVKGGFKEVLKVFQASFSKCLKWAWRNFDTKVSRVFQRLIQDVLRLSQKNFESVSRGISGMSQRGFKKVSKKFQRFLKSVSRKFVLFLWNSSQLPEQKESLLGNKCQYLDYRKWREEIPA